MVTLPYTPELFSDVMESMADYQMTGWTVCGTEDPAVITLGPEFAVKYPELSEHSTVRVVDRYVNCALSETLLEFSSTPITDQEQEWADQVAEEA